MLSLLRLERQEKDFFKTTSNYYYYSFVIETTNKVMHSLENHTRIHTKIGKVCTRFQTKTA